MFPFKECSQIKILVIPVGKIEPAKFDEFFELISSFKEVNLEELTLISSTGSSLFKNQKILKGNVHVKFLKSFNRELVNLEEFQIYRQYLGIIGVIHCPSFPDLSQGYARFNQILSKFPKCMNVKCLAFEPEDNQPDDEKNVIMFPNQSRDQLHFYVGTMIADFISSILQSLSGLVDSIEKKSLIQSPLQFDSGTSGEDIARIKRRTPGRVSKLIGDLYLLGGNLEEAINCFANAIEYSKVNIDDLWLASAQEGFLVASYLQTEQIDSSLISKDYYSGCLEKVKEIMGLYENSKVSLLAADTSIKIARVLVSLNLRGEANQYLAKAWSFSDSLSFDEKIYLSGRIAKIYKSISYFRKFAFFTRILSQLVVKNTNPFLALACYKKILPIYKLDKTFMEDNNKQFTIGWPLIQKVVMKEVMEVSHFTKDLEVITFFTTHFLRQLHHHIGSSEQQEMMDELKRLAMQPDCPYCAASKFYRKPRMSSLSIVDLLSNYRIANASFALKNKKSSKDPFLYNPFSKSGNTKTKTDSFMVQYETSTFMIYLDNPMAFPVTIQSMSISVTGMDFESTKSSLIVPAYAKSFPVPITGRPLEFGEIVVTGISVKESKYLLTICRNGPEFYRPLKKSGSHVLGVKVKVLEAQPFLKVQRTSFHNDAMMLIEGEVCPMQISLENIGSRPIEFLNVHFKENTNQEKNEFGVNDHEIEYYADQIKVFEYQENDISAHLPIQTSKGAGTHAKVGCFDFNFSITGKLGCLGGTLTFEYGNKSSSSQDPFYTRTTNYSFLLTVTRGLECTNVDILPYQRENLQAFFTTSTSLKTIASVEELVITSPVTKKDSLFSPTVIENDGDNDIHSLSQASLNTYDKSFCLLTIDLKNNWHNSMTTSFKYSNGDLNIGEMESETTIMPNNTKRIVIPLKRLDLSEEDVTKPYPPIGNRQFVVPKGPKLSASEQEFKKRSFWFKNKLLSQIKISWESSLSRKGSFVFYDMRLNRSMLSVLKTDRLIMEVKINGDDNTESKVSVKLWEFVKITFTVINQHRDPIKPMIRIFPVEEVNHRFEASEWSSKIVFGGSNQRVLDVIDPEERIDYSCSLTFLVCGKFRFLYHCEDLLSGQVVYCSEPIVLDVNV